MKHLGRICVIAGIIVLNLFCFLDCSRAAERNSKFFQGVEFLTGFSQGETQEKGYYELVPLAADLDFNLKVLTEKIHLSPPGLLQFQLEPFVNVVVNPKSDLELGHSFALKVGILPDDWAFQPYVKAGVGVVFMTLHVAEQSTQFNYIESYVVGAHCFFNKKTALTLEGRFRHLSNASRKLPNHGINTDSVYAGILYLF